MTAPDPSLAPDQSPLERLADLLMSNASPENVMDASTLDGFMAAALIGPEPLHLSDLLPWIWDMDNGKEEPKFDSVDEAKETLDLVIDHWNALAATLAESPQDYEPVLFQDEAEDGSGPVSVIDEWCYGFVMGLQMQAEAFEELPNDLKDLLGPIFLYGTEEGWPELERLNLSPEQHEDIADALPDIVTTLYQHFHP